MKRCENVSKMEKYCPNFVQLHESGKKKENNKLMGSWGLLNFGMIKSKMRVTFSEYIPESFGKLSQEF